MMLSHVKAFAICITQIMFYTCLSSNTALADHMTNDAVKTVDIPTTFKLSNDEDWPSHEVLSYTVSDGGITVSIRATNHSEYRATLGLCEVVGYKEDESFDETMVNFYNQLGPGFNMVGSADFYISKDGHATWDKSNDISRIKRVEIECNWTMRDSEPSELVEFNFDNYRRNKQGTIFAAISVVNNSDTALNSYECAHTGIKNKQVMVSGFQSSLKKLQPGQNKLLFVKLLNIIGHDSHIRKLQSLTNDNKDILTNLDDIGLYCNYTGGPD